MHFRFSTLLPAGSWRIPIVTVLWLGLLLASLQAVAAHEESEGVEIEGTVAVAPADSAPIGLWSVAAEEETWQVQTDASTEFPHGVPQPGQQVHVKGAMQDGVLLAERMEIREQDTGEDGETEWEGLVLVAPPDPIGAWIIQLDQLVTRTVTADAATRFDKGVPVEGDWIEAEGALQADQTLLATRIRPHDFEASEVVVRLQSGAISTTVAADFGLEAKSSLLASGQIYLFSVKDVEEDEDGLVDQLEADARVMWAELNYVHSVPLGEGYKTWGWGGGDDSGYVNQQAYTQINLAPASGRYEGNGLVIAVLDTGVDYSHAALLAHLLPGRDVISDDFDAQDEGSGVAWGHGTHIAGIIARVAPQSQILPVRVLDSNGRGNTFLLAYALQWAVEQGADVINLSLGTPHNSRILREVTAEALAQGVVVVAAAGNQATATEQYPAAYAGVLGVTAVDETGAKAAFANYGSSWVDLAAPGVGIMSTIVGLQGSGYASWSGTSMATGFASGAAALVRQKMPVASVSQIQMQLTSHAANLDLPNQGMAWHGQLGGLLDIGAALADTPAQAPDHLIFLPGMARQLAVR